MFSPAPPKAEEHYKPLSAEEEQYIYDKALYGKASADRRREYRTFKQEFFNQ
jgi:hypothetical protein